MKSLLLLFFSLGICMLSIQAQTYNMASGTNTISTCSGTFYDSGGSGGNYGYGQDRTVTFCPSTAGAKIRINFTSFATENSYDFLYVYDGTNTAAPSLGVYTGTSGPGIVQATPGNASGCVTFRFTSDGSFFFPSTDAGWAGTISCIIPCQSITANWVSSTEAPEPDGVIRICQGQSVNFVGSGTFGTSSVGATYTWSMGNGATVNGANINYTYPASGSYLVNLTITDPSGCTNSNSFNRNVQVSTTPTISTTATPVSICTNQISTLNAAVTMTPYNVNCTPPVSGTTFLPDGSGVSYTTAITTSCYSPSATVTAATDITNVCLNIEHSYMGDLDIRLICPNGSSISLKDYPGGAGTYLGSPLDDPTVGPGTGSTYCFTPSATTLLVSGTTVSAGSPLGSSITPGNYMPVNSFAGLIGCPLNGAWTIQVTDHLAADNGYIFNWDVNFSGALLSAASFTPTIASQSWLPATYLTPATSTSGVVLPLLTGAPCFNYSVTDNFGCTYTAPQCITVACVALPVGLNYFNATVLARDKVKLEWQTESEKNSDYFLIERSKNGLDNWQMVSKVPAKGNSESISDYAIEDEDVYLMSSYYRLRQYDLNGELSEEETRTVMIDAGSQNELVLYPNPSQNYLNVRGGIIDINEIRVFSALGQDVSVMVAIIGQSDGSALLNLNQLRSGVYTLKHGNQSYLFIKE